LATLAVWFPGDATEVIVKIVHSGAVAAKDLPMLIARVALPAGLQPRLDKLRELKQARLWLAALFIEFRFVVESCGIRCDAL
jgi:hypothetical protein